MDFGWPNAEIGRKMANGRLLFLALIYTGTVTSEQQTVDLNND